MLVAQFFFGWQALPKLPTTQPYQTHQTLSFAPLFTSNPSSYHLVICPLAEKKERVSRDACCGEDSSCLATISTMPTPQAAKNMNSSRCLLRMFVEKMARK
jgi:hypothetical protein